ncbi:MAG TPA: hypothetical protein ENK58_02785 [Desulfobacterales bacterium]|nr:hypothetical protein [Desulfobacterales bacterium]
MKRKAEISEQDIFKDSPDCFNPVNPLPARVASSTRISDKQRFSAIPHHLHGLCVKKDFYCSRALILFSHTIRVDMPRISDKQGFSAIPHHLHGLCARKDLIAVDNF